MIPTCRHVDTQKRAHIKNSHTKKEGNAHIASKVSLKDNRENDTNTAIEKFQQEDKRS